ncbi:hypothetical protein PENCOP_c011G02645 [Penicillium coprophilum]|uniref:Glycosyl hydrolase family 30 beta sandwich domain-containing protein n=1 Tax=Penicillium coprophilum TaxID=36646 RepID=A0A1V6UEG2_9EURO|nr:hypothetical protein PENCOP_c011G02645 [Penicillium coprophilum]
MYSSIQTVFCLATAVAYTQAAALSSTNVATVEVNTEVKFQELDGFGVSQAFQRAGDIYGKEGLSKTNTKNVLDLLFSIDKGAGFAILRNGIGSSNSSTSNFMNSIEPFTPGSPDASPHYVWDRNDSSQFPLAQEAYDRGLVKLYGNAWSAPGYMKTNGDENNGGYLCGVSNTHCESGNWMQAYANYLVQWARFYKQSGVKVTNLGFLNEPGFAASYAGMQSDGTQAAEFIRVLAKTIKASGMDLAINCCDSMGWEGQEQMMAALQAGPDPAEAYLSIITGHGYETVPDFPLSTKKKTWVTEWADLSGGFTPYTFFKSGASGEGMTWARNIQVALVDANVSGVLYWIGAESSTTDSGLINLIGDEVIPSKRFWAFAQFSRFARPGARRVKATSSAPLLYVSSFLNHDGSVATQVINNGTEAYEVSFKVHTSGRIHKVQPWVTNNDHDLTALKSLHISKDGSFKSTVPAHSMMTFVS